MKKIVTFLLCVVFSITVFANGGEPVDLKKNFITGSPEVASVNAMAFGPQGILFIGDSKNAMVFAIDTGDEMTGSSSDDLRMEQFDQALAAALGTTVDNIVIQDLAVNPLSKKVYVAVHHVDGSPALLVMEGTSFLPVKLENIKYSFTSVNNAVGEDAKDGRGRPLRGWAISDLSYFDGQVLLTGLSNAEFSSTFRSIAFPFNKKQDHASLEIYHAAHGRYETESPVKTFTATTLGGKPYLVASYTCTPLVLFPMDELKAGKHVKGRTVAELGNRNTPLDMISYERDGKSYLLLANSSRAMMRIGYDELMSFTESLSTPVEGSGTAGIDFINLPYVSIQQLDAYDDERVVVLQRKGNGNLDLETVSLDKL